MRDDVEVMQAISDKIGQPVRVSTEYCNIFKKTHSSCVGCESETGCRVFVKIKMLIVSRMFYEAKSFQDSLDADKTMEKEFDRILEEAKEPAEKDTSISSKSPSGFNFGISS